MMRASSPTAFYLMELARVLVPVVGISFVLATVCSHVLKSRAIRSWLIVVTGAWLFVTLGNRLLLFAPLRKQFLERAVHDYASAHQTSLLFAMGAYGWIAEEVLVFAFGILLFFTLRSNARRDI
jgi:hypothetical protein